MSNPGEGRPGDARGFARLRLVALLLVVGATVVAALVIGLPAQADLRAAVRGWGWWAAPAFAAVYAVASLAPLPKTVLTLAAGAVFGVATGLVVVVVGATVGACLAFGVGRGLGRDGLLRVTRSSRSWAGRLDRVDRLMARRGFVAVLVARLVPVVPFTALNYAAGVTACSWRVFVPATVLGILPATTAYVVLGATAGEPGSWPFLASLAALAVLSLGGLLVARRPHPHP